MSSSKERQREKFRAIRAYGLSVMHVHDCRYCGDDIFIAFCATDGHWRAFDRWEITTTDAWAWTRRGMAPYRFGFMVHDCPEQAGEAM